MPIAKDIELICALDKKWQPGNIKVRKVGGQTNRNYFVQYKSKKRFIRLPWEETGIIDRKIEAKNVLALAKCKKLTTILPKYYLYIFQKKNILSSGKEKYDLPDGAMVMEYIKGKDIDGKDLKNSKIQQVLLKTLYIFHSSGVKFRNPYDVFRDEILKYRKKAKKYPINKLIGIKRIKEIERIEDNVKKKSPFRESLSTHNDLIFENLRLGKNGRVYLLDFEYAGFNMRDGIHYDLGIILGGNLFQKNPIKIETFEEVLKKAKKIYRKDLSNYKIYQGALTNILVMFWWGMVKYFTSTTREEEKYFKDYVLKRAEGIYYLNNFINKKRVRTYSNPF